MKHIVILLTMFYCVNVSAVESKNEGRPKLSGRQVQNSPVDKITDLSATGEHRDDISTDDPQFRASKLNVTDGAGQSDNRFMWIGILLISSVALCGLGWCLWTLLVKPLCDSCETLNKSINRQAEIVFRMDQTSAISKLQGQLLALLSVPAQVQVAINGLQDLQRKAVEYDKKAKEYDDVYESWGEVSKQYEVKHKLLEREQQTCKELKTKLAVCDQDKIAIESLLTTANETVSRLEGEIEKAIEQCGAVSKQLTDLRVAHDPLVAERDSLFGQVQRLMTCLPVVEVEQIYCAVRDQGSIPETDVSLRYIFSRIAVLAAIRALEVNESDKPIMLRDAFNSFDMDLYARFKNDKTLLRALRDCFSEALKPLLAGYIAFEWPTPDSELDLKKHKPEVENGLGVIREVKSAVLFTGAGSVSAKAVVLT